MGSGYPSCFAAGVRVNTTPSIPVGLSGLPRQEFSDYTLGQSELLLMSDVSRTSFDSRYFGPVNVSHVKGVIRPVFTF